jgi:menaquinone-dependent protoporphyrinogen oxidase
MEKVLGVDMKGNNIVADPLFLKTEGYLSGVSDFSFLNTPIFTQEPRMERTSEIFDTSAKQRVLVAYATMAGSTVGIAEEIGKILRHAGYAVDVKQVDDIMDVTDYTAAVIGSPIHGKAWMPEALEFVRTYRHALGKILVAYFTSSITLGMVDSPNIRRRMDSYLIPLQDEVYEVEPVSIEHFAGVLDFKKLPFVYRLVWPFTSGRKAKQGDYRNWHAIKTWAASLVPVFV